MAVGDIYRVALIGDCASSQLVNVVHFQTTVSIGPVEEEVVQLARALESQVLPAYAPVISGSVAFRQISVRGITNPTLGYDLGVTGGGSVSGDVVPLQVAPEIVIRTAKFGRSFRGKIYLWPCGETALENGQFTAAFRSVVADLWAAFQTPFSITPNVGYFWQFGVYSKTLAQFNAATSYFLPDRPRTQRRRRPGVGQ